MSSILRSALGSVAKLGDLYDARYDKFCGISILKDSPPDSAIQTRDNPFCDTKYIHSDKYSEKFEKLDVNAELKLSVLSGLLSLEGSGRYLSDEKSSKRAVRCTLMHNICTKVEELSIYNDALKEFIATEALKQEATHVVIGINWGANLMVTAEYTNEENEDSSKVAGALQAHLKKVKFAITGKAEADYGKGDAGKGKEFSLNIYGDVLPEGDLPQDIEGALELLKKLPTLIQKSNDGKGKPLQYVLLPVDVFKSHFNVQVTAETTVKKLAEDAVVRFVQLFDQITDAKQQLNDLHRDVVKHRFCLLETTRKEVEGLKSEADISESRIRSQLAELLVEVRKGRKDASELEKLRTEYEQDPHSAQNILKQIQHRFADISDKINTYKLLTTKHGVIFVPNTVKSLDALLLEHASKDLYILFSESKAKVEKKSLWNEHLYVFMSLILEYNPQNRSDLPGGSLGQQSAFLYVDLDIAPQLAPQGNQVLVIQHYKELKCIAPNLHEDYARDRSLCLVKSGDVVYSGSKPNKRVTLQLRCPASLHGQCEPEEQKWTCFKCKTDVEYGFDGYFYCSCGRGKAETYSYRCSSKKHGSGFQKFCSDETTLTELLGQLKPMKELNILILGETGVGKSTWINAIVNYISYPSLEEAASQDLQSVIPTSFVLTDDDYKEIVVKTGEDANEDSKAGNSATQYPKSYTFPQGDTLVRLIDTPGIGDVRGVEQDKENFQRILDHLSFVDEIHGICILLKPNNARLSIMFQFCINELLTHLHRDASKNIVFCFTNARQTFYKPGDSLQPLKRLLEKNKEVNIAISKHTMYCMDNEAFRFLAALKHGIQFSPGDRESFSASWKNSVDETSRLLTHFASLTPHKTKDTLSLNEARRMILELTKPLADISKHIQDNINVLDDKKEEVSQIDVTCKDLSQRLKIPSIDLKCEPLSSPRTVCGSNKCIEIIQKANNAHVANYKQVCHEGCQLNGITLGTMNLPELKNCFAMTGGLKATEENPNCNICGCEWFHHMHQTIKTTKVNTLIEDVNVQQQLAKKVDDKEALKLAITTLQSRIEKYKGEQKVITMCTAHFAAFLKRNAITPYNDIMSEYLDHLIELEKRKIAAGQESSKTLENLKNKKHEYTEEVKTLEERITSSNNLQEEITLERIDELVKRLYNLPLSGPKLKNMMYAIKLGSSRSFQYFETPLYRPDTSTSTFRKYLSKIPIPKTWIPGWMSKRH